MAIIYGSAAVMMVVFSASSITDVAELFCQLYSEHTGKGETLYSKVLLTNLCFL